MLQIIMLKDNVAYLILYCRDIIIIVIVKSILICVLELSILTIKIQKCYQIIPKKTKSDNVKTGITKPKPTTKSSTKSAIKTSPVKQTKASSNANSKLPRVKTGSATRVK